MISSLIHFHLFIQQFLPNIFFGFRKETNTYLAMPYTRCFLVDILSKNSAFQTALKDGFSHVIDHVSVS